jgi:hypothetical protein
MSDTVQLGVSPTRFRLKQAFPQAVHVARFVRMLGNQVKFPIAAAILDWQGKVQVGPFAGMRFPRSGTGNFAEMLGTYEICLSNVLGQVIARKPDTIVDVGAAWGYYSMGLAIRCPESRLVAYEVDPTRFELMQKYNRINALEDRITMRGLCTPQTLATDLQHAAHPFMLMDIEGAEDDVLRADIPGIERAEMLVEIHEVFIPGLTKRLEDRFSPTHHFRLIEQADLTNHPAPPNINQFVRWQWKRLIKEDREQPMAWMHLVPRNS